MWESVILNVFETGINAVSFLPVFQAVFLLFLTPQWRLRHMCSSGWARFIDHGLYWRTRACLLCIFVPPPTVLVDFSCQKNPATVRTFSYQVSPTWLVSSAVTPVMPYQFDRTA